MILHLWWSGKQKRMRYLERQRGRAPDKMETRFSGCSSIGASRIRSSRILTGTRIAENYRPGESHYGVMLRVALPPFGSVTVTEMVPRAGCPIMMGRLHTTFEPDPSIFPILADQE